MLPCWLYEVDDESDISSKLCLQCNYNEFTCNDGRCVDLDKRCNKVYDCSDGVDERNCDPIEIDKEIYRNIQPPVPKLNKKLVIGVTMDIRKIDEIDEILMTFHAEVEITFQWRDHRIAFKHLDNEGNFLNKFWQHQIWMPPIAYSNNKKKFKIAFNGQVNVEIQRKEFGTLNPITNLDEGQRFEGNQNDLILTALQEGSFFCLFEFSNFPFDTQDCSIDLHIPREIKNYITMEPKQLIYSGK